MIAPSRRRLRPPTPRRVATVDVGALGGLIVGVTSVGSGTLIVVLLLGLYPAMRTRDIVGTDLIQAIPLVGSAALGHVLFGNVQLGLTTSLVLGSVPGVVLGAQISSRARGRLIRPVLVFALVASGLKLLSVATATLAIILLLVAAVGLGAAATAKVRALRGTALSRAAQSSFGPSCQRSVSGGASEAAR
jgi:uncharacterized protein